MKKTLLVLASLGVFLNAQTLIEQQEESLVKGMLPSTKIEKVERSQVDGFYKAYLSNGNIFYLNPFKRVIFIGELYTTTGVSLTANDMQEWKSQLDNKLLKNTKIQELTQYAKKVKHGKGSNRYEFVIFTDPECPFCLRTEEFFEKENVDLYVNFYPLSFHPNAKKWSEQILSSKDIKTAMKELRENKKDLDVSVSTEAKNTLENMMKLGEKLNIQGTPKLFVIDKKENKIIESIDGANIKKFQDYLAKDKNEK
ncbi:protein disulfide isomerase, DsbC family [Campylobacter lari]|uniref:DsbC family protein n=1 Tax=Campylobacter lari TaxID=201 RepID=UPI001286AB2C|nr:DsbC family protein [Campylobacter lari]MBT0825053.1 DsbC family protein [Campylobacter lari]MCR6566407.1 DsbC family protein [Campylobacter lari]